jgi:hypothetical protein
VRVSTRYRKSNIRDRQREANRLHKILEDTGIKLDCVASDLLGKSGRAMLDALVSGTTDPNMLADLARGVLRNKLPALREARGSLRHRTRARRRPDPRPHRLPRRRDRAALGRHRAADRPVRARGRAALHDPPASNAAPPKS